jgi:hypothetical protein
LGTSSANITSTPRHNAFTADYADNRGSEEIAKASNCKRCQIPESHVIADIGVERTSQNRTMEFH